MRLQSSRFCHEFLLTEKGVIASAKVLTPAEAGRGLLS